MLKKVMLFCCSVFASVTFAQTEKLDLNALGNDYFNAWTATQKPDATAKDIDTYLALLAENVGHQHLPYDSDDSRAAGGKTQMREGMMFYLGGHSEYQATLTSITTGHNVIVIQYDTNAKGVHPQTKETISLSYDTTEVLEIENGKISVIRKYSE